MKFNLIMNLFQKSNTKQPYVNYSRSKEMTNGSVSKIQDVTRYNSSNCNVYLYKSSPNRGHTPIKAPMSNKTSQGFYSPRKTKQELMLLGIAKSFQNLPMETKKKFVLEGSKTQMRITTTLPSMTEHRMRKIPYVLNDFHIRETNPGFARNDFGGFFTH